MSEKTNFHPYYVGTEHGRLSFGQLRKKNTEISACMLENGRDAGRHYFTMDSTGDKEKGSKGSTKLFCPGTLTVKTGKDIVNYDKGATLPKEPSIPGIVCMAENGDITENDLSASIEEVIQVSENSPYMDEMLKGDEWKKVLKGFGEIKFASGSKDAD